jgi:hypothetical protein|tara:strand:- start:218 stop:817 length:600 start_codon:yes stop_codon:yes gene_type:complete
MATYQDSRYNIALPSGSGGAITLIKTVTASSDSTINFVNGTSDVVLDNTYRTYIFKYISIHPSGDGTDLQINFRDGSTAYDATKTTTAFRAYHNEAGDDTTLSYQTSWDLAQGTGVQLISHGIDNDNDGSASGELYLFNPSSTTFVKHFISISNAMNGTYSHQNFIAGYCNVTAAIDGVQFSMSSGTIDSGTIKLYGIT